MRRADPLGRRARRRSLALAALLLLASASPSALARPGGGSSFKSSGGSSYKSSGGSSYKSSGGSSYKSSSGSGGSSYKSTSGSGGSYGSSNKSSSTTSYGGSSSYDYKSSGDSSYVPSGRGMNGDDVVRLLFFLGLPLCGIALFLFWRRQQAIDWQSTPSPTTLAIEPAREEPLSERGLRRKLEALRELDPDFSVVVFEDFLYALYAAAHEKRGQHKLRDLTPWLADHVRGSLRSDPNYVRGVHAIVIGAMTYLDVDVDPTWVRVRVRFEANYTESVVRGSGDPAEQSYWVVDDWTLERDPKAKSRAPAAIRAFDCPSCGGPLGGMKNKRCAHCGQVLDTGAFDWLVTKLRMVDKQPRGPMLTGTTEEEGTELPTVRAPEAPRAFEALSAKDPSFAWDAFTARVQLIFAELQTAWSTRDWSGARPFVSDNLFSMMQYWIDTYQKQRLRNVTEDAVVSSIEGCRVTSDKWYDAITVRIHASSKDYVITDDGEVVGGSKTKTRAYTEYWTLIRGASTQGPTKATKECPKCGAGLNVNAAGTCAFCNAHVTAGEFDWVLSRIEQDEVYDG